MQFMRKFLCVLLMLFSLTMSAEVVDDVMEVLKYVESLNDPKAVGDNGMSYGVLQIQKACVEDVNKYYGTHYRHEDMFQVECAEEVFRLYACIGVIRYEKKYGKKATEEVIVRNHNGGIYRGYRIKATEEYYRRYKIWKSLLIKN